MRNRFGFFVNIQRVVEFYDRVKKSKEFADLVEGKRYFEIPYVRDGKFGVVDLYVDCGEYINIIDSKTVKPNFF